MLLLFVAPLAGAQPVAAQWPTTDWEVVCTDDSLKAAGHAVCDDSGTGAAGAHRGQLEAASRWLQDLGFPAPVLSVYRSHTLSKTQNGTDGDPRYRAEIAEEKLGLDVGAYYERPDDDESPAGSGMNLSSVIGGPALGGESVHELFHGVQQSYRSLEDLIFQPDFGGPFDPLPESLMPDDLWITEGTADAVRIAFGRHTGQPFRGRPVRQYDTSLAYPCGSCGLVEQRLQVYQTANFWLALGEMLGSRDQIQYFQAVWRAIGVDADVNHQGLRPVDTALRAVSGKGLATHYPNFIVRYANDAAHYTDVETITLSGTHDRDSRLATAERVAADAYRVRVKVPEGETTTLDVSFAADHPDLHLIVDGQRLDTPAPGAQRNTFRRELTGRAEPYEYFVRVANVAHAAEETTNRTYTLVVKEPQLALAGNVVADFSADYTGDPDEIPYTEQASMQWQAVLAIETGDAQSETDLATGENRTVYPDEESGWKLVGSYIHKRCAPGHPDLCNFRTEETFSGKGLIAAGGGALEIVSTTDGLALHAELPVTVTTRVHDPNLPERTETHTQMWALACQSAGQWWGDPPESTHYKPADGALAGRWATDAHQAVQFDCQQQWQPMVYGPDSGESSNASLGIHGRVRVTGREAPQVP